MVSAPTPPIMVHAVLHNPPSSLRAHSTMTAQHNRQFARPVFFPGGVADPSGTTGYISVLSGGIEAIELTTGRSRWHSGAATRALMVLGQQLPAVSSSTGRRNVLEVVLLDRARQGRVLRVSDPVVFPDWVDTTTSNEELFTYQVCGRDSVLLIEWEAHARYRGGAPPPSQVLQEATKDAVGTARVDLRSGRVTMLPRTLPQGLAIPPALQQAMVFPYKKGTAWHSEPWLTDTMVAMLTVEETAGERTLTLQRWDPATQSPRPRLPLGSATGRTAYVTPDGSYLLLHDLSAGGATGDLSIFRVTTGELAARWPHETGLQEISILGSHLYSLVEDSTLTPAGSPRLRLLLKARSLVDGQLRWERLLQERQPSRPPPPRP
jgi:hypothetical protein